jgi:hypothetical protein
MARPRRPNKFTVILAAVTEMTVEMADALFEAGCDDSSPWSSESVVYVAFDREAESLGDAIGSAVKDVMQAAFSVARIDVSHSA